MSEFVRTETYRSGRVRVVNTQVIGVNTQRFVGAIHVGLRAETVRKLGQKMSKGKVKRESCNA